MISNLSGSAIGSSRWTPVSALTIHVAPPLPLPPATIALPSGDRVHRVDDGVADQRVVPAEHDLPIDASRLGGRRRRGQR
jgi:hypothetical protein